MTRRRRRSPRLQHPRRQGNDSTAKYAYSETKEQELARRLVNGSEHLGQDNVEVLSNSVSASSHKLAAYNTISRAIETSWKGGPVTAADIEAQSSWLISAWDSLVRRGRNSANCRRRRARTQRKKTIASSAVVIYGLIGAMSTMYTDHVDPDEAFERMRSMVRGYVRLETPFGSRRVSSRPANPGPSAHATASPHAGRRSGFARGDGPRHRGRGVGPRLSIAEHQPGCRLPERQPGSTPPARLLPREGECAFLQRNRNRGETRFPGVSGRALGPSEGLCGRGSRGRRVPGGAGFGPDWRVRGAVGGPRPVFGRSGGLWSTAAGDHPRRIRCATAQVSGASHRSRARRVTSWSSAAGTPSAGAALWTSSAGRSSSSVGIRQARA